MHSSIRVNPRNSSRYTLNKCTSVQTHWAYTYSKCMSTTLSLFFLFFYCVTQFIFRFISQPTDKLENSFIVSSASLAQDSPKSSRQEQQSLRWSKHPKGTAGQLLVWQKEGSWHHSLSLTFFPCSKRTEGEMPKDKLHVPSSMCQEQKAESRNPRLLCPLLFMYQTHYITSA